MLLCEWWGGHRDLHRVDRRQRQMCIRDRPYSASKWVTVEKDTLTLEPNKNVKLKYTITVPKDVTNGEYNVEIFLVSESDFAQSGTAAFANLASGTPILIQIGDEFVENAELLKFITDKDMYEKINVTFLSLIHI